MPPATPDFAEGWLYTVDDHSSGIIRENAISTDGTPLQRWADMTKLFAELAAEGKLGKEAQRMGALTKAYNEAVVEARKQQPPSPKPTTPAPHKAVPQAATEAKTIVQDSAAAQAAPDVTENQSVDKAVVIDSRPSPAGVPAASVGEIYWSPYFSGTPSDTIACTFPKPETASETDALIKKIERNEPPVADDPHPTHSAPFSRSPATAGEPVDLFSGAFVISTIDLVVPGAVRSVAFERSYRSGRPYYGPFGYGWDHSFNIYLRRLNDGRIALWDGQLHEQYFYPEGATSWVCEAALAAMIQPLPSPSDGFVVTRPQGVRWRFERPLGWGQLERIPLLTIADRHGNTLHLKYDAMDRLTSVLDDAGRGLVLRYGQCGLLEEVSDHTGTRTVLYDHHPDSEHLVRVTLPATAQFPDGIVTRYDYDLYAVYTAMRHNIIRITDSSKRIYVENEYYGPEYGWAFNTVRRQFVGDYEYSFEYEQIQWVAPVEEFLDDIATRTTVRRPDDSLHFYTFNYRGDLLDHRYRLNADRTYRVVSSQWRYDPQGNVTLAIAPDDARLLMTFDTDNPSPCGRRDILKVEHVAPFPSVLPRRILLQAQYDPNYQLPLQVIDEELTATSYVYDWEDDPTATGRLVRIELAPVTLPDHSDQHSVIRFEHNTRGQATSVVLPDGTRNLLEYVEAPGSNHKGFLSRTIQDAAGVALTTEYEYDPAGHALRITRPGGRVAQLHHNLLGQLEEFEPPAVEGVTTAVRTWFGDDGSPLRVERPRGNYTGPEIVGTFFADEFERDVLGRWTAARLGANTDRPRVWRRQLDDEGRPVREIDPAGLVTTRRYDERGSVVRETRSPGTPDEAITTYSHDRLGRVTHIRSADGSKTANHYDPWGRLDRVELPGGATRINKWGSRDLLLETIYEGSPEPGKAPRPLTRETYKYDERGRLVAQTRWSFVDNLANAVPLTTRTTYDKNDRASHVQLPRGSTLSLEYDGIGRLTLTTDEHGTTRARRYNAAGDFDKETLTQTEGGVVRQVSRTYEHDGRGRVAAVEGPSGRTEFGYDDRDTLLERREPGGVTTRITTGPFGETTATLLDPGGLNIHSRWTFDNAGRVSKFTDPMGATTTWEHDQLGRTRKLTLPDGSIRVYEYDVTNRTVDQTMPSGTHVSQTLNANGQPVRIECTAPAGVEAVPIHEFEYDALGRLVRATHSASAVDRRYDSLGRVVRESAQGATIRVAYNDLTGDVELEFPDGRRERTQNDTTGRPTRVTLQTPGAALGGTAGAELATIRYAAHPVRIGHANGMVTTLMYDRPGRFVGIDHSRAGLRIDGYRARYDERNRRALVQNIGEPTRNTLHTFDCRDRLTDARWGFPFAELPEIPASTDHAAAISEATVAAATAATIETYVLDQADGRTQRTRGLEGALPAVEANVLGPDHRIVKSAGRPISHHVDGPRASDNGKHYDIDALGRVVRVRHAITGVTAAEFTYDALSRAANGSQAGRAFKRAFIGTTWIHETSGAAGETRQATPHPIWPQPLCISDAVGTLFIHPDEGMSTVCVTDASGSVRERHRYGPFGTPELFAGDGISPLAPHAASVEPRWRGMPYVASIEKYAAAQRLYDPDLGVFLAPDPLMYIDSPSPWVFAAHDPVNFTDPTGRDKKPLGQRSEPDWTTQTEWAFYDLNDGSGFKMIRSLDTGVRPVNALLNKVLLPWLNATGGLANMALATVVGLDDYLSHSVVAVEYKNSAAILPMAKTMGIAAEAPYAAEYLAGSLASVAPKLRSAGLTPLWWFMGCGGGGALPPMRSAREAATRGFETSLVDVAKGNIGMSSYNAASGVSKAVGFAGAEMEAAHVLPQAIGKTLPAQFGYGEGRALTTYLPRAAHTAWDQGWVHLWKTAVKSGTPVTAGDAFTMVANALETPSVQKLLTQQLRNTLAFRLEVEMFSELGLEWGTKILP